MSVSWIEPVQTLLSRWDDKGAGRVWVVAVSGGSDSVALLRVLHQLAPSLGLTLSVAHLDHGVRGDAARADADFVADLSQKLGLPIDLGHWQPSRAGHFEADARHARYAWLLEIARARAASAVVVGHTRDDQAETILHRIIRGTGLQGLRGIPARRRLADGVALLRPLLNVSRLELRAFLDELGQSFRDDASNTNLDYTRARIRHDLLPRIAGEYNPRAAEALVRLGAQAASALRAHQKPLAELEGRAIASVTEDEIVLACDVLRDCPEFLRVEIIRRAWRRAGWPEAGMSARRWQRLSPFVEAPHPRAEIGAGIVASSGPVFLVLRRSSKVADSTPLTGPTSVDLPGSVHWGAGWLVATLDPEEARDETIDLDRLALPLRIRAPEPGDRFDPLGMGGQSTPLKDFLRSRRVAREARAHTPLLCDTRGIIWVVGHRIAERVRLRETTCHQLGLRWDPEDRATTPLPQIDPGG